MSLQRCAAGVFLVWSGVMVLQSYTHVSVGLQRRVLWLGIDAHTHLFWLVCNVKEQTSKNCLVISIKYTEKPAKNVY